MRILKTNRLYCFSPPVMIATCLIEAICAVYVLVRYTLTPVSRLAVAILVGLAVFQLAEYNVCVGSWGVNSLIWARIGYVAITLLPPLGLHLATKIAGQKQRWFTASAYGTAVIFAYIFLFVGQGMTSQECLGNYVIFHIAHWAALPFAIYYYGWLLVSVVYAIFMSTKKLKSNQRQALIALTVGYLAFILPTTAANIVDPSTIAGIPSIMCGFAVLLALVLTGVVLPRATAR